MAFRVFAGLFTAGSLLLSLPGRGGASGYEFDGVGARSIARGGAVIADAADWTAIYWNPANLADVKRREAGLELKGGASHSRDGNSFNVGGAGNIFSKKKQDSSFFFGSAGSVVPLDDSSAVGVGVYLPLLQGAKFKDHHPLNAAFNSIDYEGSAAIAVGNISYARRLTEKFAGAVGVNAVYGRLKSDTAMDFALTPPGYTTPSVLTQSLDGSGYGVEAVFGGKYEITDRLFAGAVFRSGTKVKITGEADAASSLGVTEKSDFKFTLKQPPTSGIGLAWKDGGRWTFTGDFTQTWWRGFHNAIDYKIAGALLTDQANTFDWKTSYKYRLGALWKYNDRTDFMAGYAYDTPAIDGGSIDFSSAIDVPMHRVTLAGSRRWGDFEGTLAGLAGYNSRNTGGVNYRLGGEYLIAEGKYRF
jgi:long-chain fatty acid transport protein